MSLFFHIQSHTWVLFCFVLLYFNQDLFCSHSVAHVLTFISEQPWHQCSYSLTMIERQNGCSRTNSSLASTSTQHFSNDWAARTHREPGGQFVLTPSYLCCSCGLLTHNTPPPLTPHPNPRFKQRLDPDNFLITTGLKSIPNHTCVAAFMIYAASVCPTLFPLLCLLYTSLHKMALKYK